MKKIVGLIGTVGILSSVLAFGLIFSGCDANKRYPSINGYKNTKVATNRKDAIKAISDVFKKVN